MDISVSIEFYSKLGLKLIVKSPDYARFECPEGDSTFSIHKVEQLPTGDGIGVYFEVNNLDELVARLAANGIIIDEYPADKSWLWRESRLKDPDNNQLILFSASHNRKNPPWRIR